jgi:hypothetical protein
MFSAIGRRRYRADEYQIPVAIIPWIGKLKGVMPDWERFGRVCANHHRQCANHHRQCATTTDNVPTTTDNVPPPPTMCQPPHHYVLCTDRLEFL